MRIRSFAFVLALVGVIASGLAACSTDGGGGGDEGLKIGLVTDVGTIDDRSFNQFSWEGAQDGATKAGAPAPQSAISKVSADIAKNIQGFVDQKYDIIVTVGFAAGADTIKAAKANPTIKFVGVDQSPCVDKDGNPDATFKCEGDASALLPNLQGIQWYEQQPGYLAGIVAASLSKTGHIAAIGGTESVPAVPNYMVGYLNGAKSVNPDIKVELQYVSRAPDAKAFNDPAGGKAFAQQMLNTFPDIDVLFQVAGKTGNGVLALACEKKLYGIGVDVDQYESNPESKACTIVSAEKKLKKNVSDAIVRIKDAKDKGGTIRLGIDTEDVGLSSFHEFESMISADTKKLIEDATAAMKAGTLQPCPTNDFGACKIDKNGQPAP